MWWDPTPDDFKSFGDSPVDGLGVVWVEVIVFAEYDVWYGG